MPPGPNYELFSSHLLRNRSTYIRNSTLVRILSPLLSLFLFLTTSLSKNYPYSAYLLIFRTLTAYLQTPSPLSSLLQKNPPTEAEFYEIVTPSKFHSANGGMALILDYRNLRRSVPMVERIYRSLTELSLFGCQMTDMPMEVSRRGRHTFPFISYFSPPPRSRS